MIREFPLTPAQQKALDSRRNIAVTASAGSGKTATLVERYIELLRLHPELEVRNVLAITFTQKAAAQMRERVARRLRQALPRTSDPEERRRLVAIYEDLSAARISTIHAFCAGLLREFPVEAEIDPNFSVVEEVEATQMRRQAVSETLVELADRSDPDPEREALRRLLAEWDRRYLEAVLTGLILKKRLARRWSRIYLDLPPDQLYARWQEQLRLLLAPVCRDLLSSDFLAQLDELAGLAPQSKPESDSGEKILAPARPEIRALLADTTEETALTILPRLADLLTTSSGTPYKAARLGSKGNWEADDLARFRGLLPEIGEQLAAHADLLSQSLGPRDRRAAELLPALARLFLAVDGRYARRKGQGAQLDFDDLQERALELLQRGDGQIAGRLSRQYRFVMVDEFQDTDPLQWDLIRPLVFLDGRIAGDKLFIVGDPKQSIYSFRGADVTVFARVREEILAANEAHASSEHPFLGDDGEPLDASPSELNGSLVMGENFRTLAAPIALVNALFPQFMRPVEGEPFQVGYDPLLCQRPAADSPGSVELLLTPAVEDEDTLDARQREADLIAGRLRRLFDESDLQILDRQGLRPPRFADVALLLRRRRFLPVYEQALRAHDLPFQVVGGLGFYQRQEIYDLANILRLLHNRRDSVALLGALRSPYFGLTDDALFALSQVRAGDLWNQLQATDRHPDYLSPTDRRVIADAVHLLARWNGLRDRVPLVELLHAILEETGAWGFLACGERGDQALANVRKFLALARDFAQAGSATLADFVPYLDLLTEEEEKEGEAALSAGEDAIQILTVHASKGLEFPVVLLPDLDGEFNLRLSDAVLVDAEQGIGISVLDPDQEFSRQPSFLRQLIGGSHRRRALAEEKRLFYVAATRARDHLLLSGLLGDHLEQPLDCDTARDRLSWICRGLDLQSSALAAGATEFTGDGRTFPVRIYTDPDQFPAPRRRQQDDRTTLGRIEALLAGELPPAPATPPADWPEPFARLRPLTDEVPFPTFAVTELLQFEQSPEEHFRQHVLGLPLCDPTGEDHHRRDGLLFGQLAHTLLEEWAHAADPDPALAVDRILLADPLPDETLRQRFRPDLLALLDRFGASPFGPLLTAPGSRVEFPFALRLSTGLLTGVIDLIYRNDSGLFALADYKTGRIEAQQKEAETRRYRRQLACYALCLRHLFPGQSEYPATLYLTHLDETATFTFTDADLDRTRDEAEALLPRLQDAYRT